ncbi:hypothetical protein VTL71DRAFT_2763 [Oculimacula yallundae]|uniref:Uncharacterized protein n=1 Tax=Oculimacula yallundae TaxID=86028 RepID=A0ABR4CBP9_9HELO
MRRNVVVSTGGVIFASILGFSMLKFIFNLQALNTPRAELHFLVPATSSNEHLCKLMISAAILRYPTPVIINWGAAEDPDNPNAGHIQKVDSLLGYLDDLTSAGKEDDLVLIVDGFDVHFQLPAEVLLKRYFESNEVAQKRINSQIGTISAHSNDVRQTVIFGQDRSCWPSWPWGQNWQGCWLAPESSYSKSAFGPDTDNETLVHDKSTTRARYLNSGTLMGPVGDVRDVFQAALSNIAQNHTTDSDQYYFANVWAEQEYSRRMLQSEPFTKEEKADKYYLWPKVEEGRETELHIGLDYEGLLWQVLGFFRPSVTWMTFNGDPTPARSVSGSRRKSFVRDQYLDRTLPDDLATSRPPFAAVLEQLASHGQTGKATDLPTHLTWHDLRLGINSISNNIFPMLHYTGPKMFREYWWPRMWFYPYAEALLKAAASLDRAPISDHVIGGKVWWPADVGTTSGKKDEKGGAFSDKGDWLPWGDICAAHETSLWKKQ